MTNELIFLLQSAFIGLTALGALAFGSSALVAFICIQCILANIFVLKQTTLFGLNAICADTFSIGATLGLNLLQEYYGRGITKRTIWLNFFFLVFFAVISQLHLWYAPSIFDTTQDHFSALFGFMPRIVIASFVVYLIAQMVDFYLYGWLKTVWTSRFLVLRNYASISVSQFVDTVLFSFLGLYGIIDNIGQVILVSYAIKLGAIIISTPFIIFSKKIVESLQNSSRPKSREAGRTEES